MNLQLRAIEATDIEQRLPRVERRLNLTGDQWGGDTATLKQATHLELDKSRDAP